MTFLSEFSEINKILVGFLLLVIIIREKLLLLCWTVDDNTPFVHSFPSLRPSAYDFTAIVTTDD